MSPGKQLLFDLKTHAERGEPWTLSADEVKRLQGLLAHLWSEGESDAMIRAMQVADAIACRQSMRGIS